MQIVHKLQLLSNLNITPSHTIPQALHTLHIVQMEEDKHGDPLGITKITNNGGYCNNQVNLESHNSTTCTFTQTQ